MRILRIGLALLLVVATLSVRASGMMGVGVMMQGAGAGSAPSSTFYLLNDAGVKLTNDAGTQRITTQ